ncbi:hypothetical protein L2E82_27766 [Cichorium intybus]|uniref:Uncharacterized protein n=1 Tax=Cichorium intybus TaxID=13427 RepID=A0ACB9CTX2_CICIN|nr:hypothetical protein L2E82_27766 [Cichorium intybus]
MPNYPSSKTLSSFSIPFNFSILDLLVINQFYIRRIANHCRLDHHTHDKYLKLSASQSKDGEADNDCPCH